MERCASNRKDGTGFTLVELLVVMTIIGLLLSISLPRYFGAIERSKVTVLKENLRVARVQIDRFFADKGRYPAALDELVMEKYLRSVPMDPITESDQTWIPVPAEGEESGIKDIHSGATGSTRDGVPYESL